MTVPNRFPTAPATNRIALIGEAPGTDELRLGEPFVGMSGRFLSALLARAGTSREACLLANVCQHHPPANELASFEWLGSEIQLGIAQLEKDLAEYNPNIIVCLGGAALHALKGTQQPSKRKQKGKFVYAWQHSPTEWRGTLFKDSKERKCLATLHPAYCLRDYATTPLLQLDLRRAVEESSSFKLVLPQRLFITDASEDELVRMLDDIRKYRHTVAIDIEGYVGSMSCISFATSASLAFIVPFFDKQLNPLPGSSPRVWRAMANVLEDPSVPKILQNSLYDTFVLQYSYNIRVRNVLHDTMLRHWEYYCELEKNLGLQASIYTKEPYYKGERKSQDDKTFFEYCCRDSAVTYEINDVLATKVRDVSNTHYRFNMDLLNVLRYMEVRGMAYDVHGAATRRAEIRRQMHVEQAKLNGLAGCYTESVAQLFTKARELMAFKRAHVATFDDIANNCKKDYDEDSKRLALLVTQPPSLEKCGEIEDLVGLSLNTSSKTFTSFLYDVLELPRQYDNAKTPPTLTADYEALLKLTKLCTRENDPRLPILHHAITIRSLSTRQAMLAISADNDGRIRCGYNIVGSETGRITCYKSPTGSGYNLQTIPKQDRDLFTANSEHWFFSCDLAGADGWTVAAYCKMLGDSNMLDDYDYGLKPARLICLKLRGVSVDFRNREALKEASKAVDPDSWDYFACKRIQHGSAYLEGAIKTADQILTDSEGKCVMSVAEIKILQQWFLRERYVGIPLWHDWVARRIKESSRLTAASGQTRRFFGRKDEILPKAVAHEPQANTTYATNLAMYNLWTDKENRRSDANGWNNPVQTNNMRAYNVQLCLRIEPLHQVHDAICGQFHKQDTSWAISRIKSYFANPLMIAGQKITIPYEGGYGPSWGQLNEGKI